MRKKQVTLIFLTMGIFPIACGPVTEKPIAGRTLSQFFVESSCVDHCGNSEPVEDRQGRKCYCDDLCEQIGDCCVDKKAVCNDELFCSQTKACPAGYYCKFDGDYEGATGRCIDGVCAEGAQPSTKTSYIASTDGNFCEVEEAICIAPDSECPMVKPGDPDECEEMGGEFDLVPKLLQLENGQYCENFKPMCVTQKGCPEIEPLLPCSEGTWMKQVGYSYPVSADNPNMVCKNPIHYCVNHDPNACYPNLHSK